jgi:simple sugar transport system permease protein
LLTGAIWLLLARAPLGLRLRACGENPDAARSAGVNVTTIRYVAVTASGALAGLGGVALALAGLGAFTENMTAGRGYIALAGVIFGRWNPLGAAGAVLFFSVGVAGEITLQTWDCRASSRPIS